jgi:hypothetical protein
MSSNLQDNVRDDVTRLLAMLNPQISETHEVFKYVRDQLTSMAILGTLPPGSRPVATATKRNSPDWTYEG